MGSLEWQKETGGVREHFSSTARHHQNNHPQTAPTWKYLARHWRDIHLINIKWLTPYLRTSWTPQRNITKTLQHPSRNFHYPPHHPFRRERQHPQHSNLGGFQSLGLNSQRVKNLLPSTMFTLSTTLLKLSIPDVPFLMLLPTLSRSRFQVKPATLLTLNGLFF